MCKTSIAKESNYIPFFFSNILSKLFFFPPKIPFIKNQRRVFIERKLGKKGRLGIRKSIPQIQNFPRVEELPVCTRFQWKSPKIRMKRSKGGYCRPAGCRES
ncbi:hypothetical protein AABB24_035823 [Solanum stoloniferum]|uniref:Uncharacterized protein n=1 Tax=Solanum stoloniferum TaxID=62892 RepID=A0ABD2RBU3_9SOLN